MKKLLLTFFVLFTALSSKAEYVYGTGTTFEVDNLKYEILDTKALTVGIAGAVDNVDDFFYCYCPSTVTYKDKTYTVVQVNNNAFYCNSNLYFIKFPSTLTCIGSGAFWGCENVNFSELPEGLEIIGTYCFKGASSIESITLPESVTELGQGAFSEMPNLRRVVMQNSAITEIKYQTFYKDEALEEVFLPLTIKKIGYEAFYRNNSLTEVYFPEGLESIGSSAFSCDGLIYYQVGLQRIELPSTIKEIGEKAFSSIQTFAIDLSRCVNLKVIPSNAFFGCGNVSEIALPEGLEEIRRYAFQCVWGVSSVVIPSTVVNIEEKAFDGSILSHLIIGDKLSSIENNTFDKVASVEIGSGIKTIAPEAFKPDNLRLIHLHTSNPPSFNHNFNLSETQAQNITVIVPDGSLSLYSYHPNWKEFNLVEESKSQVEVNLDGSLGLGAAIYKASGVLPSRVTSLKVSGPMTQADLKVISENMFSLTRLDIHDATNITEIPADCFKGNTLLTEMILPESIRVIGSRAFYDCNTLRIDKLPQSLVEIKDSAFYCCYSLKITELPDNLVSLGKSAFQYCSLLRSITAGPNLKGKLDHVFIYCYYLEYVDLSRTKIEELLSSTFLYCKNLRTALLPNTLKKLGYDNFAYTFGLRSITLPGSITDMGRGTFRESHIKALGFGEGIQNIGYRLFIGCPELVSASLPASTKKLDDEVFANCPRLRFLSCAAMEAPATTSSTFAGIQTQKSTLTVPADAFFSYLNAPGWGKFGNFEFALDVEVPDDVEVTVVPEEDYEEMVQDEELENEQLENSTIPGEPQSVRARRISARKKESSDLLSGIHFAKVFNGATIQSSNRGVAAKGNRFFIFGEPGKDYEMVLYNDADVTDKVIDGQLVLPVNAMGQLRIVGQQTSIEELGADIDGHDAVYNLRGVRVGNSLEGLPHGVYIVRQGSKTTKQAI